MKSAPMSKIWTNKLLDYASFIQYEDSICKSEIKELYTRMPDDQKQTAIGQEIRQYIYPEPTVGIGDEMVDGDLYDRDDSLRHISEFRGNYILLDFWICGCGPCISSIPEMEEIITTYKDRLVVIGISEDPKNKWKKVIAEKQINGNQWNELRNNRTGLATRYRVKGIPHYVLIAPDGKIQDMWHGYGKGYLIKKMDQNFSK